MYKYKYVRLDNEALVYSIFTDHRRIIDEHAEKGYRFVGFIPVKSDGNGKIKEMDLIFETQAPQE